MGELLARMSTDAASAPADGDSALLVVSPVRRFEGSLEASMSLLMTPGMARFGSPTDMGQQLFQPLYVADANRRYSAAGGDGRRHRADPPAEGRAGAGNRARLGRRRVSRPLTSVIASQLGQQDSARDGETVALPPAGSQER